MSKPNQCEVVSWNCFYALARRLARQIRESGYRPDIIVAIGRGGYMPARVLSDFLGLPDLTSFKIEHYVGTQSSGAAFVRYPLNADLSGRRVLLVDDVNDSGETFSVAIPHLMSRGEPLDLRTAVLHQKATSSYVPNYYVRRIVKWRWVIYPWAIAEDLGSLIKAMQPEAKELSEIAHRLAVNHRVRVPLAILQDVLAMMKDGK